MTTETTEKTLCLSFVPNGSGLALVADHDGDIYGTGSGGNSCRLDAAYAARNLGYSHLNISGTTLAVADIIAHA